MREALTTTANSILRGPQDGRLRCSWRILLAVIITFGVGFGFVIPASAAGLNVPDWAETVVVHPVLVLGVFVAIGLLRRYVDHRNISDYGFNISRRGGADAFVGLVLGFVLQAALFVIEHQQGNVQIVDTWTNPSASPLVVQVLLIIIGFIAVSVWEETLFRGIFITNAVEGFTARGLSHRTVVLGALLSSSIVFGFSHGISGGISTGSSLLYALSMTTISGVLYGWGYLLSGGLAFPIGLHTGVNLTSTMIISRSGATYPKIVEYSVSDGSIGFQTSDPASLLPVYAIGLLCISGYFYLRYNTAFPDPRKSESPTV